jgi:DNA-binding MarR family transcriptional regulator
MALLLALLYGVIFNRAQIICHNGGSHVNACDKIARDIYRHDQVRSCKLHLPDDPDETLNLGEFLCFAIYSANHAFNRVYKPLLDGLELTYPQYLVMVLLWENDDQTVGSLGDALFLDSSTLTPLLKRLEAIGHISRSRDPKDERQVRVRLSEQGRALKEKALGIPGCILDASGLSPDGLQRLRVELTTLRDALARYNPG